MDRVSAGSKFLSEFGTHDTATTITRVNGDADIHIKAKLGALSFVPGIAVKVPSTEHKVQTKIGEAGDPRYRLPQSQLDSPVKGGQ